MIRTVLVEQKMIYEEQIAQLTRERDEARREVCNLSIHPPRDYALERGWDCFKDNP